MPQTIDQKIVQMEFDNQRFEKNISQSMNSINNLNKSLKFDSVEKGFGKLQKASETLNMTSLSSAVETVKNKFSALEVIGVTALANITNSAVNAGKKLLKSLSTDNIIAGWEKYNDITNSTQVIMSATGEKIEKVEDSLSKLNWFTDETSYNLVDMTSNIGKFTSAGVGLDDAVDAMQGIALEAALSGANAEQASRAMYNFSQSLGVGAVKLQDWMSIENANMATKEFKEVLIETAKEMGYVSKAGQILHITADKYNGDAVVTFQNLRNTLSAGWLDSKVLTEALKKYGNFATRLQEIMSDLEIDTSTSNMLRYIDQYKNGIIDLDSAANDAGISSKKMKSILKELSSEEYELGLRAFKAGQEAKTFKDAINATSDAVSTGWMKVFKTVGGNYEEAKVLWTNLANDLWDVFAAPISNLNDLLSDGFTSKWKVLTEQIDDAGVSVSTFEKYVSKAGKKYNVDVDKAVAKTGSFYDALKSGEVPITVVRDGFNKMVDDISKMNSAQLKSAGYTKETVNNLKDLASEAKKSDSEFSNLLDNINNMSGRELFVSSLTNGMKILKDSIEMVKEAYRDIFPEKTGENVYSFLEKTYVGSVNLTKNFIEMRNEMKETVSDIFGSFKIVPKTISIIKQSFKEMIPIDAMSMFKSGLNTIKILSTEVTKTFVENESKIKDSFDGLFAGLDIIKEIFSSGLSTALKIFLPVGKDTASAFLDISSGVGKAIVSLRDWLKANDTIGKTFSKIGNKIEAFYEKISNYTKVLKESVSGSNVFSRSLENIKKKMTDAEGSISSFAKAPFDKIKGSFNGIGDVMSKSAKKTEEFVDDSIKSFKKVPSKLSKIKKVVFDFLGDIPKYLKKAGTAIQRFIKESDIDINKLIKAVSLTSIAKIVKEIVDLIKNGGSSIKKGLPDIKGSLEKNLGGIKDIFSSLKNAMDELVKGINVGKVVAIAISVGILAKSIVDLSGINLIKLAQSVTTISLLVKEVLVTFVALTAITKNLDGKGMKGASLMLVAIGKAISLLADSVVELSTINFTDLLKGLGSVSILMFGLTKAAKALGETKIPVSTGVSILLIGETLKLISKPMIEISKLEWSGIAKGLSGLGGALAELVGSVLILDKYSTDSKKMLASAASLLILTPVIKRIGKTLQDIGSMQLDAIGNGLVGLGGALAALVLSLYTLEHYSKSSKDILLSALALDLMIPVIKRIAKAIIDISSVGLGGAITGIVGLGGGLAAMVAALVVLEKQDVDFKKTAYSITALNLMVPVIKQLAKSIVEIGSLSLGGVVKGLAGLGLALGEMVAALLVLKTVGGNSEMKGLGSDETLLKAAAALLLMVPIIKELGGFMVEISSVSWPNVAKGLVAMGAALAEMVAAILVVDSVSKGTAVLSGKAIRYVAKSLDVVAEAMIKFGSMSWDEIKRGLAAMGAALAEITAGGILNIFSGLGGHNLTESAKAIGDLADGMSKWKDVTVPSGLTEMMAKLADAIFKFTFDGIGAEKLKASIEPIGDLAESIAKWSGVSVPKNLPDDIGKIANAIFKFTLDGSGAKALSEVAKPLGDLAKSVVEWTGISVPKDLPDKLSLIAKAVRKFTLDGPGAKALATAAEPLGVMADSVSKWTYIEVPDDLGDELKELAADIRKFMFVDIGVANMKKAAKPLGDMANAVLKWSDMKFDSQIGDGLKALADGIAAFGKTIIGEAAMELLAEPLGNLAASVKKWDGINLPKNLEDDLLHLAHGISGFNWDLVASGAITLLATSFGKLADSMKKWDGIKLPETLEHDLLHLANGISGFNWELVATGVIKALVGPLGNLAGSVKKWEGVEFPTGMQAGLTEIANGVSQFKRKGKTGALVISELVSPLGKLAESMKRWIGVIITKNTTDGIAALANSIKVFNKDGKGADALSTIAKPLGDLASSVLMWKDVTLPSNLNANLSSLAEGVLAFDKKDKKASEIMDGLSGPLVKLATAVLSWSAVKVPDTIETDLTALANGIGAFSKDKSKASEIIDGLVKPIADLSGSMIKWKDVEIPTGIDTGLKALAEGLHGFSKRDKNGNEVLTGLVKPIGELAGSMSKWKDITFPSGMKDGLMGLGTGLASLNWDTKGSEALSKIAKPLGDLADSASKWKNVSIPESVGTSMENLADGVASFNRKKVAAETISKLAKPLMDLCDAAMKWSIVDIPDSVGVAMKNLSDGLNSFNWKQIAAGVIDKLADPLMTLADAAMKWCLVTVPKETTNGIDNLVNSLKGFKDVETDSIEASMNRIVAALKKFDGLDEVYTKAFTIGASIVSYINLGIIAKKMSFGTVLTTALSEAASFEASYVNVGKAYISSITAGITASTIAFSSVLTDALKIADSFQPLYQGLGKGYITSMSYGIQSTNIDFGNALVNSVAAAQEYIASYMTVGTSYATALESGFGKYSTTLIWNFAKILSNVVESTKAFKGSASNYSGTFYQVGTYCAIGFINGANGKSAMVWNAFYTLGKVAYNATKKAINAHSPSKKFGELGYFSVAGYVNEVYNNLKDVSEAGKSIGSTAMDSLKEAIDIAKDAIDSTVAPVIKPVIDMTDIIKGKKDISKTLQAEGAYYKSGLQIATSFDKTKNSQTIKLDYSGEISQGFLKEAIGDLKKEVGTLRDAMKNAKVYLDKKTVVGSLVTDMDKALGTLVTKKGKNT